MRTKRNILSVYIGGGEKVMRSLIREDGLPSLVKSLPAMQETWVQFLGQKDPLEKEMATHSSMLVWRIP